MSSEGWDRSYSWSKVNGYETCPRQFKFRYVDELEEDDHEGRQDGKNFHNFMDEYYRVLGSPEKGPDVDTAVTLAKELWSPELQAKYRPWLKKWHAWNEHLYETWGPEHWTPVFQEKWVEVEIPEDCDIDGLQPGEIHHGFVDRIQWNPERESYGVIDYKPKVKTGSRIKGQTAYYGEILLEIADILDQPVEWAGCYGYRTGKFKMWDIHWRSTRATKRKIHQLRTLEDGWEPDFGYHCDWCPFVEECSMLDAQQEGLLDP